MLSTIILSATMLSVNRLNVVKLSSGILSPVALNVIMPWHYAERCYTECHFTVCQYAKRQ